MAAQPMESDLSIARAATIRPIEEVATKVAEANDAKFGKIAGPLRAALAGRTATPSVFDMMLVLGREETIARLTDATG
jgi:glutamyl-tRNA synthetase